ncbi:MAG: stage II sporulation protein P [Zhaonellaceae bacterium]|jgi:stage II sporulation protein P|nr:stage II sporulation protein P [Clostridia bacterium]
MNRRLFSTIVLLAISLVSIAYFKAIPTINSQNDITRILDTLGLWENERDDGGYYTIVDEQGNVLDKMSRVIYIGDELIAEDNNQYRVEKIIGDTAVAKMVSQDVLADHEKLVKAAFSQGIVPVQTKNNGVALYHTHSAESYVPTDGTDSLPGQGGILKVGDSLAQKLQEKGVKVEHSKTPHEPRDANAYRRSRRTALELLKTGPNTIIDVHRDGIPDPNFYSKEIAGNNATSIRLVVGRQNQNMQANLDFAKTVKAGMNEIYPGLVKSIFMAKGNYNQDLAPRSMLIEVGTHTNDRSQAEKGARLFADALPSVLGIATNATTDDSNNAQSTRGDWSALWWVLGVFLIGGALFLLISTGSFQGAKDKLKQFSSSEWANFLGKISKDKVKKTEINETFEESDDGSSKG